MTHASRDKLRAIKESGSMRRARKRIGKAFEDLRNFVDNINKAPAMAFRNGIYQEIDKDKLYTHRVDSWMVGYGLKDLGDVMQKMIAIKCDQKLKEVTEKEREPVINGILDVFLDRGVGELDCCQINEYEIRFSQTFQPMFLVEKNPNIVTPGGYC